MPGQETTGPGREQFQIASKRSLDSSGEQFHIPSYVPTPLNSLIGREEEEKAASLLLMRPDVRLLALIGTGGIGKTRLALKITSDHQHTFHDGCCFIALAPISAPEQLLPFVAQKLGLQSGHIRSPVENLQAFLGEKHFLLVLDNFEHILNATSFLVELLARCSRLKILVTSRALLGVQGEYAFGLHPLELPDLKRLPEYEALARIPSVTLFLQRAQAIKPDFQITSANARIIAEICVRLDGLPLAIELAAARVKVLSPQMLLAQLEHRFQLLTGGGPDLSLRQQTLHNTLTWSYDLLSTEEQWLFRHLAVFVDGCTLEAVEVCAGYMGKSMEVLDVMALLVDKSLLQRMEEQANTTRFMMLETIREYSLELLANNGELVHMREAHAAYYQGLAGEGVIEAASLGMPDGEWTERLAREYRNAYAALQWLLERKEREGNVVAALRLATVMGGVWFANGSLSEGQQFLEQALAASADNSVFVPIKVRADATYVAGWLIRWRGDDERSTRLIGESLALYRELGDKRAIAHCLNALSFAENHRGNFSEGDAMRQEALLLCREVGDKRGVANILLVQGVMQHFRGDFARVHALCGESLALYSELGDTWSAATNLHYIAWAFYSQGEYIKARQRSEECIELFRKVGQPEFISEALTLQAYEFAALGEKANARTLFEEALVLGKQAESAVNIARALEHYAAWDTWRCDGTN